MLLKDLLRFSFISLNLHLLVIISIQVLLNQILSCSASVFGYYFVFANKFPFVRSFMKVRKRSGKVGKLKKGKIEN